MVIQNSSTIIEYMNKICTSVEQSKRLIELGIDISTADMRYGYIAPYDFSDRMYDGGYDKVPYPKDFLKKNPDFSENQYDGELPAWSLSALLELMPSYLFEFERGIDLSIYPNINGKAWHCSYMPNAIENMKTDKFKQITNGDSLVDAAYDMVIWLKKNKLL